MTNQTKYSPRIVRGQTEIWVPHSSGEIGFVSPALGADNYIDVGKAILSKNFQTSNGDYTASLLHSAYCSDALNEPEFKNVKNIMKRNWLWVFNRNLWTEDGLYVILDKDAIGRSQSLNINDLEEALKGGKEIDGIRFSEEGSIRFAPKGSYKLKYNAPEEFAKSGVIIASCGEEGAEKLGEVSVKFKSKPCIYGLEIKKGQNPELRVSAVVEFDDWLWFDCGWVDSGRCRAFGVLK